MLRALSEFEIDGVPTTAKFHEAVLRHPIFREGTMNTGFVEQQAAYFKEIFGRVTPEHADHAAILAAILAVEDQSKSNTTRLQPSVTTQASLWHQRARLESVHRGGL
jgi:acetyl/propionyl-CoA carboxylase alpha subunit